MMRSALMTLCAAALLAAGSTPSLAQQRPLTTQDPETIGGGRILVEGGLDYGTDVFYPASGLTGNLLRAPLIGVVIGLSPIAELQVHGGLYNRLTITRRELAPLSHMLDPLEDRTDDVEDLAVATKVRVASETAGRPAVAIRLATRLPNATNESGLGLDTMDFFATLVLGKTFLSTRVVGNVGLGILGDPVRGDRQNDVLVLGVSVARAVTDAAEVVGEINARANTRSAEPPPGTENRGLLKAGVRYTLGAGRVDAALLLGLTERDPGVGVAVGYTHVFNAFRLQ